MSLWRRMKLTTRGTSTSGRFKQLVLCCCILASVVPLVFFDHHTISYSLRPLWDTPPKPFQAVSAVQHMCESDNGAVDDGP